MRCRTFLLFLWTLAVLGTLVSPAWAHKPSDSYVVIRAAGHGSPHLDIRWDIALRDLDDALDLDADGNGELTWAEVKARAGDITAHVLPRLTVASAGAPCIHEAPDAAGLKLAHRTDGTYAVLHFGATCAAEPAALEVTYELFFERDPQHRGLVHVESPARSQAVVFAAGARSRTVSLLAEPGAAIHQLLVLLQAGVEHIAVGTDHLAFLLALLLPAVLRREGDQWVPVPRFRTALGDVAKIVTAFTVAHSITLSLATLGIVQLPSRLVESGIAVSVVLAALNNLRPLLRGDRWLVAFALGLLHGFGFSAALTEMELPKESVAVSLLGFNLGVEAGQLFFVLLFLPPAFLLRRRKAYRIVALQAGSVAISLVATTWVVERVLDVKILPFGW